MALWRVRKGCRKRDMQSLADYLSHACKVVRLGRMFLSSIFVLLSQFRRKDHFVRLNASFRADLEWWHVFLSEWNGVDLWQRVELEKERGKVEVWMDASGSWGCGTLWDVAWSEWPSFG